MSPRETLLLVQRARGGDGEAWGELLERYYNRWLGRYHADLGSTIRKLYDTQDLVQSAVGDAMRDIPDPSPPGPRDCGPDPAPEDTLTCEVYAPECQ